MHFCWSTKSLLQTDIIPLIENVKKAEQLVDKMAVVEHMNVVNELQNGKALSYGDCSLLSWITLTC
jgi:hypothetical protein